MRMLAGLGQDQVVASISRRAPGRPARRVEAGMGLSSWRQWARRPAYSLERNSKRARVASRERWREEHG
jgi:hypothetical protein